MPALGSLALSYAAGALSTLSPCILPILPLVLLGAIQQHPMGPLALALGLSGSFALVGTVVASVGFSSGLDPSILRGLVAVLMMALGIVILVPAFQRVVSTVTAPVATGGQSLLDRVTPTGLKGQFLLGVLLGAIWSPCSGPALGLAAQTETMGTAATIMIIFGLGAATPIVALAYGSRQAVFARRDRLAQISRIAKPVVGSALIVVGAFVITGLDKTIETILTQAMPDWLVNVTTRL